MIAPMKIENEAAYIFLVESYYYLVDMELKKAESRMQNGEHESLSFLLPRVMCAVNTIGYLRGQDNIFVDFRPPVSFQRDLYAIEGECERRLSTLLNYIATTQSNQLFIEEKHKYFSI
ncbi:hypothetical protein KA078_03070 [Candidatus Woesebacteria bacterium]|nr:hypothetical protein [Candidatus Woesebacteria bacterium]